MPEVARALVLPDLSAPPRASLLSLVLTWENVGIAVFDDAQLRTYDAEDAAVMDALTEAGALEPIEIQSTEPPRPALVDALMDAVEARVRTDPSREAIEGALIDAWEGAFLALAREVRERVRLTYARSALLNRAPVAAGFFSHLGSLLPPASDGAPREEAALISAAVQSISVDPSTPVDKLLRFRETSSHARGRFRAAMIDLAQTLRRDAPALTLLEEADAVVRNRIEPALGDLEDALNESFIKYVWQALFSTSSVALGPVAPGIAVAAGGRLVTRSIDYAFDRKRLVRDHPYGYLHELRSDIGRADARRSGFGSRPITDPSTELEDLMVTMARATADVSLAKLAAVLGPMFGQPIPPHELNLVKTTVERWIADDSSDAADE